MAHDLVTELLQYSSLACFMPIWQLCANLLIPNCLRSNLSYSPLAALELYVKNPNPSIDGAKLHIFSELLIPFDAFLSFSIPFDAFLPKKCLETSHLAPVNKSFRTRKQVIWDS